MLELKKVTMNSDDKKSHICLPCGCSPTLICSPNLICIPNTVCTPIIICAPNVVCSPIIIIPTEV